MALLPCLLASIGGLKAACKLHGNIQHKDGCSLCSTNLRGWQSNEEHRENNPYLFFWATIDIDRYATAFPAHPVVTRQRACGVPGDPPTITGSISSGLQEHLGQRTQCQRYVAIHSRW